MIESYFRKNEKFHRRKTAFRFDSDLSSLDKILAILFWMAWRPKGLTIVDTKHRAVLYKPWNQCVSDNIPSLVPESVPTVSIYETATNELRHSLVSSTCLMMWHAADGMQIGTEQSDWLVAKALGFWRRIARMSIDCQKCNYISKSKQIQIAEISFKISKDLSELHQSYMV